MIKTAVCCIASKLEKLYLEEWAKHHHDIGFLDIYVYLNNWDDEDLGLLKYTDFNGKMVFTKIDGSVQQLNAYNHFIKNHSKDYHWAAFIDCDEFIHINSLDSLEAILERHEDVHSLAVNWRLFGSNGLEEVKDNDYSIKRFTRCSKSLDLHIKQIVNFLKAKDVKFMNPHFHNLGWLNQDMKMGYGPWNRYALNEVHELEIWHYVTKSKEECKLRRSFIRADTPTPREEGWEAFFKAHDKNEVDILSICYR